jgi:hypothetical protein
MKIWHHIDYVMNFPIYEITIILSLRYPLTSSKCLSRHAKKSFQGSLSYFLGITKIPHFLYSKEETNASVPHRRSNLWLTNSPLEEAILQISLRNPIWSDDILEDLAGKKDTSNEIFILFCFLNSCKVACRTQWLLPGINLLLELLCKPFMTLHWLDSDSLLQIAKSYLGCDLTLSDNCSYYTWCCSLVFSFTVLHIQR